MPIDDTLSVNLDVNPATGPGGLVVTVPPQRDGWGMLWASTQYDGADAEWWMNPLDPTLQLKPLQLQPDWPTNTSGDYARLRKTDWDLTSADWDEVEPRSTGDYFLLSKGTNEQIATLRSYSKNQPFVITFRAFAYGGDSLEMIRIGFGQYTASLYASGEMKLSDGETEKRGRFTRGGSRNCSGELITLLIQPYKKRRILFWSPTHEGGWIHTEWGLDETVTDAGPLTIEFPASQGMVQASHAVYEATAEFITPVRVLPQAPPAGATTTTAQEWDVPSGTGVIAAVQEAESLDAVAWDGTKDSYRVLYSLIGGDGPDGRANWTPFVYGARVSVTGATETRTQASSDITDDVLSLQLEYRYGLGGHRGKLRLRNGEDYGGSDMPHNRLINVKIGTTIIFLGVAKSPERTQSPNTALRYLDYELEDIFTHRANNTLIPGTEPLDGKSLEETVETWFELLGAEDGDWIIPDLGDLAWPTSGTSGRYLFQPGAGDNVMQWFRQVERVFGYTFDCLWDTDRVKFRMFHPADPAEASVKTFYLTEAAAIAAEAGRDALAQSYYEQGIQQEVTQLGLDYCTEDGHHSLMVITDSDAEDPTTEAESRPTHWLGERLINVVQFNRCKTDEDALRYLTALVERPGVMDPVRIATWQSEYDPAIWPNATVSINGSDWRVLSLGVTIELDTESAYFRPCTYIAERAETRA